MRNGCVLNNYLLTLREEYQPKIVKFQMLLKDHLEIQLTSEREGYYEDLLMVTILDPR